MHNLSLIGIIDKCSRIELLDLRELLNIVRKCTRILHLIYNYFELIYCEYLN